MNLSTPRNVIFPKAFLSKNPKQIEVELNHSTDPSHKPCNLIEADTHAWFHPPSLCGTTFVFKHSVIQIRLQAERLNLFHHKGCWFEWQLSLKCHAKAQEVLILNKTYLFLCQIHLRAFKVKKYFHWYLLSMLVPFI